MPNQPMPAGGADQDASAGQNQGMPGSWPTDPNAMAAMYYAYQGYMYPNMAQPGAQAPTQNGGTDPSQQHQQ